MNRSTKSAIALATLMLAAGASAQRYKVIELPTARDVADYAGSTTIALNETGRATVFEQSNQHDFAEVCGLRFCKPVPKLPKHGQKHRTYASDINDAGQVVGQATERNVDQAFLLQDGVMTKLGPLVPGTDYESRGAAINNLGEIVGYGQVSDEFGDWRGFHWKDGVMTLLPTLGGTFANALDINDAGTIVGSADLASGDPHAYIYSNGVMTDLGTLGGRYSTAFAVNSRGEVAGESDRWNTGHIAIRYRNGVMEDLGNLPKGDYSSARGINDAGDVVGFSRVMRHGAYSYRAVLVDANGSGMLDLNDLLRAPDRKRYTVTSANDINNQGDIAASARRVADDRAVAVILKRID